MILLFLYPFCNNYAFKKLVMLHNKKPRFKKRREVYLLAVKANE